MWESIRFSDKYYDDIVNMSIENFGTENDICHKNFLNYQYFDNPAGKAIIELAVDPKKKVLAGQYVITPAKFRCFGRNVNSVLSLNTLTRKAYRGQKIFVGLAEKAYSRASDEGFSFCYGAPNGNSYHGFVTKLKFDSITQFPLYMRPINLSKTVLEKTNKKWLATLSRPFGVFFPNNSAGNKAGYKIEVLSKSNIGLMDEFWDRVKDKYPVMGVRDSEYLGYRYLNVPRRTYYPYVVIKDDKVVAFAVGRIREVAGITTGMLADFLFINGNENEACSVVREVVYVMKKAGANLAGCIMLEHTDEAKLLKKVGFIRCPQKILPQATPLILRVFDDSIDKVKISDIKNWFFTTGDYDVV